jgi:hypothetical protein
MIPLQLFDAGSILWRMFYISPMRHMGIISKLMTSPTTSALTSGTLIDTPLDGIALDLKPSVTLEGRASPEVDPALSGLVLRKMELHS